MNNEKLSENFDLEEFTRSDKAKELGITNEPGEKELAALRVLVGRTIQPLRDKLGLPIHVNSGYRCPELNKAIGGVPTSQHQKGEAADLSIDGKASDILERRISVQPVKKCGFPPAGNAGHAVWPASGFSGVRISSGRLGSAPSIPASPLKRA